MKSISKVELKFQLEKMGIRVKGNYVSKSDIKKSLAHKVIAGLFTWKTSDTKKTLIRPKVDVPDNWKKRVCYEATLLLPDGKKITGTYDGYGRLDDKDIFAEIEKAISSEKGLTEDQYRDEAFNHLEDIMELIKLVENPNLKFEAVKTSEPCPTQGFIF